MTRVASPAAMAAVSQVAAAAPAVARGLSISALPPPSVAPATPTDALGEMLAMMDKLSRLSMGANEQDLVAQRAALQKQCDEFVKKIADAIRKQEAKEHESHGFFGSILHAVGDVVGKVLGTIVDAAKDVVVAPVKIGVGLVEGHSFANVMRSEIHDLSTNGDWAKAVEGFSEGVASFAGDLQDFLDKAALDIAEGHSPEADAKRLWSGFKKDVLENPDFWKVAGALAEAASVGAGVMTGGLLAWVAVGVMALNEADNHTHLFRRAFGPKAAPWVKLGTEVAGSALLGFATLGKGDTVTRVLKEATAIIDGSASVARGVKIMDDANARADAIEQQADMQRTLNQIRNLQRLIKDLIEVVGDKSRAHQSMQKVASHVVQTQSAVKAAALMRA